MSYVEAVLEVSPAVYAEVRRLVVDAGRQQAFHGIGKNEVIDMSGFALQAAAEPSDAVTVEEPFEIVYATAKYTGEAVQAWLRQVAEVGRMKGVTFSRATVHEQLPGLVLYEGWASRPADMGAPRWPGAALSP